MLIRLIALLAAILTAAPLPACATRIARPPHLITIAAGFDPIQLQRLSIKAEASGGMASTTLRMVLFNPNPRQLEGALQFPLLDGQQITAFALDVEGVMRPAVPVGKAQGQAVFEAIERRQVDPALLETTEGNNFKLRIYPIPAGGTRTVELRYIEPLARAGQQWTWRLPLAYGKVGDFDLDIRVDGGAMPSLNNAMGGLRFEKYGGGYRAGITRQQTTLDSTLDIAIAAADTPIVYRQTIDNTTWFVAEVKLPATNGAPAAPRRRPPPRTLGLLWDSSGSGASRNLDAELAVLERYFQALGSVDVRLVRLRDRAEPPVRFQVRNGDWAALRRDLATTVYDGASALDGWQAQADVDQYLLFSDGLINYKDANASASPRLTARQSLFALNSARSADGARLAALAEASHGELIEVDPQRPLDAVNALLYQAPVLEGIGARGAADVVAQSRVSRDGILRVAGRLLDTSQQQLVLSVSGLSGMSGTSGLSGMSNGEGALRDIVVPLDAIATQRDFAATLWGSWRIRQLEADADMHRAEIGRIGRQLRIPSRATSLIVLDRLDDYVRNDIEPPPQLKAAWDKLKAVRMQLASLARSKHFDTVLAQFERKVDWWKTDFWPRKSQAKGWTADSVVDAEAAPIRPHTGPSLAYSAPSAFPAPPPPAPAVASARSVSVTGSRSRIAAAAAAAEQAAPAIGIALKKWTANAPYIERLRAAPAAQVYAVYLDEKPGYANSSAFYLDAADILFDRGLRELGMRVLSNLAEMDLENRAVLRILGYRLLQAGAPQLALPVFEKVARLAPEEPQSFRDLGLAQAAAGKPQQAIDSLYEVVLRPWDARFPEIETIAVGEINAIVAAAAGTVGKKPLDTSRIDPRLLRNLPLDLRVVLAWDADNTDMDLWVTDPSGERCDFAHPLTAQGGRMSRDFTQGYGPEEFSLRRALPGTYRIEANYYGNRQQIVAGATTLQVKLYTGFGTARQKEQVVTLRLKDQGEAVYVGQFEVGK